MVVLLLVVLGGRLEGRLVPLEDLHGIRNRAQCLKLDAFIWVYVAHVDTVMGESAERLSFAAFVHTRFCLVVFRVVELLLATMGQRTRYTQRASPLIRRVGAEAREALGPMRAWP
jgi:hypothetical protein